jgi:GNAT superfamily N-acetyltransferase
MSTTGLMVVPEVAHPPLTIRQGEAFDLGWTLVAERDGAIVGSARLTQLSSYDLDLALFVDHAYRGQGIGTALLRDAATEAAARSYRSIRCLTHPDGLRLPAYDDPSRSTDLPGARDMPSQRSRDRRPPLGRTSG